MGIYQPIKDKAQANRDRVAKRRTALRARGLRPKQIWIPDTRVAGFWDSVANDCSRIAVSADQSSALSYAQSLQYWPSEEPD